MSARPAITVLMPAYNCASYVGEAIQSIQGQTFTDFEFLIIDDGSSDDTREVIRSFQDPRIRYLENQRNLGTISALNLGLRQARGIYVARMDADDISLPDRLQMQYELMERSPQAVVCGTSTSIINGQTPNQEWLITDDPERLKVDLIFHMPMPHGSIFFRRDQQREAGVYYNEGYPHAEDYFFLYQLSRLGEIRGIEDILYRYRMHGEQTSTIHSAVQRATSNKIRAHILADLGVPYTERDWEVHTRLSEGDYQGLEGRVGELEAWLGKLHHALSAEGGYDPRKVSEAMWNFWVLLCLSLPPHLGVPCLARILRPPLSRVFPLRGKLAPKMLLYYIYRQVGDALSSRRAG